MSEQDARSLSTAWYYKEQFGFSKPPPVANPEVVRNMALALLAAAGSDGVVTPAEHAWIVGYLATKGYPDSVIAEVRELAARSPQEVASLMQLGILKASGRILIYDTVRAASVDRYDDKGRAAVRDVARALGLEERDVTAIEKLVADEAALKARRIETLMPGGHPNL